MRQRIVIQKLLAAAMLLLFAVSAAPKVFFHELLANHQDVQYCEHPVKASACLHATGINCHFDSIVVNAPFLLQVVYAPQPPVMVFGVTSASFNSRLSCSFLVHKPGRAPPTS